MLTQPLYADSIEGHVFDLDTGLDTAADSRKYY